MPSLPNFGAGSPSPCAVPSPARPRSDRSTRNLHSPSARRGGGCR
jgi:hypothetical protein